MTFRTKCLALASGLIFAGSIYAGQEVICPNIDDIKAEGLNMAEQLGTDLFFTYNISEFNTDSSWGFVMAPIEADSAETALEESNELLDTMSAPGVPQEHENEIICEYNTGTQHIMAAAVKNDQGLAISKFKQLIRTMR
jgi:hypothetical protein